MKYRFDCRYFTGYKPCKFKRSCQGCGHYDPPTHRIVIVSLEALGAVLRSTCLLEPIRRAYPGCHITWVTMPNAKALLDNNPYIDRILPFDHTALPLLEQLTFDVAFVVDKSLVAGALGNRINAKEKRGFGCSPEGAIVPFNLEAEYQFAVGLDDDLKFFKNQKPETQQITETMGLEWVRDPYVLGLSDAERRLIAERKAEILAATGSEKIIGYSTGCSLLYPYKKFTIPTAIEMIRRWRENYPDHAVALFGGREDTQRNQELKEAFADDSKVVLTPTTSGLRSGVLWMGVADVMLTGCSLGLHISIALAVPTITWFGVSCAQEIDLYDNGVKLRAQVTCSPCWRKSCDNEPKCYDKVDLSEIVHWTGIYLSESQKIANN